MLAVLFVCLASRFPRYVRNASGPALNEPSYERVMNPHFREEVVVTDIGKMTVVADGSETRLEIPQIPAGRVEQPNRRHEYHSIAPGERFEDEIGTISFDYFAIAYGVIPVEEIEKYSIELPADHYNGNLEPLSDREIYEFAAETGIVQKFGEAEVQVAAVLPGMHYRGHARSSDNLSMKFATFEGDNSITSVVIASNPEFSLHSAEPSFFDSGGKELRTRGQSSIGGISVVQVFAEPDEIRSIRMKHYPNSKRLVFHFPSLPGLPEQNRSVSNLFKTQIPYIRIRDHHEMVGVLEKLTGLRIQDPFGGIQPAAISFPVTYQALTVEELFEEYLALREGTDPRVRVDAAAGLIKISEPNSKWLEWINRWWQRLKP